MSKQFWAVIVVIVLVLVGVAVFNNKDEEKTGNKADSKAATSHVQGKGTAGVTIVEYGDFQCPYCQVYHTTVKQVVNEYGDQIKFQFVNFPLTSIHQNAFAAARAAEAASMQGKYWEMHDKIYENADPNGTVGWVASQSPSNFFNQFAKDVGLDVEQFKKDYASAAVNNAINADLAKGNKLKVEATPTFFINGKKTTIGNSVEDFKKVIDKIIQDEAESKTSAN